jgi:hypothetical protein
MHDIVKATIVEVVKLTNYIFIYCDKVTNVDD